MKLKRLITLIHILKKCRDALDDVIIELDAFYTTELASLEKKKVHDKNL